jgi:hypothetical protein
MSTIIATNNTSSGIELVDLRNFLISVSGTETLTDYFSTVEIARADDLFEKIASTAVTINNGIRDLSVSEALKFCVGEFVDAYLYDEYRDRSGKLRVHQTSRKLGLRIMWTGVGDDPSDPTAIGGGETLSLVLSSGTQSLSKYIDFNIVENETWVHEGYITWAGTVLDTLTLDAVPRVTNVVASSGTNYNLYGGYLIIPAAGNGTIDITSDITTHSGGLVYIPDDDIGNPPDNAFWNADWNSTTEEYENITPAPYGNGRYNMFANEVVICRFLRDVPFASSEGFIPFNSSDTDQLGHGIRLKIKAERSEYDNSDTVMFGCTICLHRKKSI